MKKAIGLQISVKQTKQENDNSNQKYSNRRQHEIMLDQFKI
jgi:hypothetical protein